MDNWLIILFIVLKSSLIIEDSEEILSSKHAWLSLIHKMSDLGFHLVTSLLLKCQQWQLHVDGTLKKLTVAINENTTVELKS